MICIISSNLNLVRQLGRKFTDLNLSFTVFDPSSEHAIPSLYAPGVVAAIVDGMFPTLHRSAWWDMLGSLGRRIPLVAVGKLNNIEGSFASRTSELVAWVEQDSTAEEIVAILDACGILGGSYKKTPNKIIPIYNAQIPLHMLQGQGALSVLTINASQFRATAIEFGLQAYQKLQDCFQRILIDMWGAPGCFRNTDVLMRRTAHSNTYYVFLEQSRISQTVPAPGVLERMADRLAVQLQNALWHELAKPAKSRILPDCISVVPEFSIGHATVLHNPCVDSLEIVEHMFDSSQEVAKVQLRRIKDRQRELMQTLVQTPDLLTPHYQAVFNLQTITRDKVIQSHDMKSIAIMKDDIYGFESLIRVRRDRVDEKIGGDQLFHLESKFLRPDILFALAAQSKVALELDQVCLKLGIEHGTELPGHLMVNILPRNLLHIERLTHLLGKRSQLVFEISESEAISNVELMEKIRDFLRRLDCTMAADDFGRGHASLERVIRLRPELIKLDRALVDGIHRDKAKRAFVEGVVQAAKHVGSTLLAEGIELWEEADVVQKMGIDLIQGFLVHRPQPVDLILSQLNEEPAPIQLPTVA
jgi:EAL domain-containing protein (putative c-di-GMP-specific phosphodiesterase class I)